MANSKYEYVRAFERDEILLPNTWIVVRIDGRGFHRLSAQYAFTKPNDVQALDLMNSAARSVFASVPDLCIAYGVSDEYSFVFQKSTNLFERRASKLVSTVVSAFTAAYVFGWKEVMGGRELKEGWLPTFDGRAVCYPSVENLRDYMSWRQVDCHINNLYNTTFWALVQQGNMTTTEAENTLQGTLAADKNEILFSKFGINYNNEPDMFRKGSVVFREYALEDTPIPARPSSSAETNTATRDSSTVDITSSVVFREQGEEDTAKDLQSGHIEKEPVMSKTQQEKMRKARQKAKIVVRHVDIIQDGFWEKRPWILSGRPGRPVVRDP